LKIQKIKTDGIDVAGHNIYIHDVSIWTQDDCISVKDNVYGDRVSSNMMFERIRASGTGLAIGSIAGTKVSNITFRDSYLYRTVKGIYLKFRIPRDALYFGRGEISNIYYENITLESPLQWVRTKEEEK
jgi:polygalacturonase